MTINALWDMIRRENHKEFRALSKVIDYIIDHEKEDFKQNPSTDHVYYHALVASIGERGARDEIARYLK
jgi:hypothetical protein